MKKFSSKTEIFSYIRDNFCGNNDTVIVRGSTAIKALDSFDDFDIEVYTTKPKKPYYEIIFYREKPILISIYYHIDEQGEIIKPPREIKVLQGEYHSNIDRIFMEDFAKRTKHTPEDKITRSNQMIIDNLFKFMRSNNRDFLDKVNRDLKFEGKK